MNLVTTFRHLVIGRLQWGVRRKLVQTIDPRAYPSGGCGATDLWTCAIHPNRLIGEAAQDLAQSAGE